MSLDLDRQLPVSPWLSRTDVAAYANVSVATIARAIRGGRLRAFRIASGRAVRLHRDDVDAWLRSRTAVVRAEWKR